MNKINEDDIYFAGIRHERKNVQPGSMADLFLAEIGRWAYPPRPLRERRSKPPVANGGSSEGDLPTVDVHTGSSDDSTG